MLSTVFSPTLSLSPFLCEAPGLIDFLPSLLPALWSFLDSCTDGLWEIFIHIDPIH